MIVPRMYETPDSTQRVGTDQYRPRKAVYPCIRFRMLVMTIVTIVMLRYRSIPKVIGQYGMTQRIEQMRQTHDPHRHGAVHHHHPFIGRHHVSGHYFWHVPVQNVCESSIRIPIVEQRSIPSQCNREPLHGQKLGVPVVLRKYETEGIPMKPLRVPSIQETPFWQTQQASRHEPRRIHGPKRRWRLRCCR